MSLIHSIEKNEIETLSLRVELVKEETDWEDNEKDELLTKGYKKDFEDVNKNFKLEDRVFMKEETKELIEEQFDLKCDNDTSQFSSSIYDKNYILKNIPRKESEEVNKGGNEVYSMLSDGNEVKFSETKEYKMNYSNWEEGYIKEEIKFEEHIPYIESPAIPSSGCGSSVLDAERVDVEKEYTAYPSLQSQECSTVKFSCSDCNMDFKLRRELKFHTLREHNKQLNHHCTICRDSFNLKSNLTHHMGFCHKGRLEVKEKEYSCSECSEKFRIPSELKIHKDMFHKSDKFKCSYCSTTFDKKTSLRSHIISHKGIFKHKYICEVCGKVFSFQSNLARHVKIHSDHKAHSCDTCGKGFSRLDHLKLHQKMQKHKDLMRESQKSSKIHADNTVDVEEFVCNICGFGFRVKQRLRDHLKLHSENRPHVCPVCNRAFKQIYNLKQHQLSHDGPRDFVCDVCNKGFRRKAFLKQHMLVHTKEKNYMCEVCGKRYYKSCHVAAHKKVVHEGPKVK